MGFSSSGALDSSPFSFMSTTSFSDLLNSPALPAEDSPRFSAARSSLSDRISGRTGGSGVPKFKSLPPPSLPISPPSLVSPSSYFAIPPGLSPAELLDSPVLLSSSNILPSPTTGAITSQSLNWKVNTNTTTNTNNQPAPIKREDSIYSDFTFQTQHQISADQSQNWKQEQIHFHQQQPPPWGLDDKMQGKEEANIQSQNQPAQYAGDQKNSDDGYNWRKYGQKQVKGSENPRSYYKCTFPGCPTKKKVERALDGRITEIVYKGSHSHPKPVKTRRSSSSSASAAASAMAMVVAASGHAMGAGSDGNFIDGQENSFGSGQMDPSVATPENSSISIVDDEIDRGSQRSRSGGDDFNDGEDGDEREAKRWKGEGESECISAAQGSKTVREPRVVVQTTSEIDILDDGYRWRKYGQKVVKGNPNPRSYYKCTYPGCPVRKHVERAAHDIKSVITTYEGKHNHDIPAARGSSHTAARLASAAPNSNNFATIRPSAVNYTTPYNPRPPSSDGPSPFLLEMIQNPAGGFEFSGFGRSVDHSYNAVQQLRPQHNTANAKDEPRDDVFFESLRR